MKAKLQTFERGFAAFQQLQAALSKGGNESGVTIDVAAVAQPLLGFLTPAIGELLIFFATLFFFLLDRSQLRKHIILVFNRPGRPAARDPHHQRHRAQSDASISGPSP